MAKDLVCFKRLTQRNRIARDQQQARSKSESRPKMKLHTNFLLVESKPHPLDQFIKREPSGSNREKITITSTIIPRVLDSAQVVSMLKLAPLRGKNGAAGGDVSARTAEMTPEQEL